jgi:ABC-type polysaccharide/polyol phosphate export permease
MAFVVMVLVFVGIGLIKPPYDWFEMMVGYLLGAWVSASLALLLVGLTEYSDVFERLWHPIAYFMLPISGLGFMVDWLPLKWQKWAMLVPMVNGLEVMREGYFGETVRCHYSMHNLVVFCLGSMLIGLTLIKNFARQIVPE